MRLRGYQSYGRRPRFEPLESRRMLSITVDTLVDENNGAGVGAGTSLREAIAAAAPGDTIDFSVTGTINLSVGASNATKQLTINKNLTINGPGASLLTIKAFDPTTATKNGDGSRVFTIDDSSSTTVRDVSISGLTLTGGDAPTSGGAISSAENLVLTDCVINGNNNGMLFGGGAGGGIFSQATPSFPNSLTIRGSTFTGNTAPVSEGGAIRQRYGQLVIENCTISNNSAAVGGGVSIGGANVQISGSTFNSNSATGGPSTQTGTGGAINVANTKISISGSTISGNTSAIGGGIYAKGTSIFAQNATTVSISNSVLSNNTVSQAGGGVATSYSTLSIINCTLSGNTATNSSSGGGAISTSNSPLTVKNSTLSGNSARIGGAIAADQGTAVGTPSLIENSTISGNTAGGTTLTDMGAIYAVRAMLIRFCTITGNTTPAGGRGAVGSLGGNFAPITVYSSIIAGNTNGDIGYASSPSPFISQGYNLIGTGNNSSLASFNQAGDQTGVLNPMLGALASNGGSTMTRLPLTGSPAIDAGNPSAVAGVGGVYLYDQRGNPYTRVWDGDGVGGARIDIGAVEVQTLPLPRAVYGDYNADGVVDGGDYVLARKTAGVSLTPYEIADGSGNGVVGTEDIAIWRAHYGETVAAGSGMGQELAREVVQEVSRNADIQKLDAIFGTVNFGEAVNGPRKEPRVEIDSPEVARDELNLNDVLLASAKFLGEVASRRFDVELLVSREEPVDASALDAAVGLCVETGWSDSV
jgi:hypothetical protein